MKYESLNRKAGKKGPFNSRANNQMQSYCAQHGHEIIKIFKEERARKLRNVYGYSYGEIAKELGVGKTTAYRWLNEDKKDGTKR